MNLKMNERIIPYLIVVLISSLTYFMLTIIWGGWFLWGQILSPSLGLFSYSIFDLIIALKERKEAKE